MKAIRLALATGLVAAVLGIATPAYATDCSNPKQPCGGCHLNREMSLEDPRPIVCYS
ncbi:MAG TPA: hypothetical protein VJ927_08685 [Actinomycetota bacterium]|nr:hypothetical protein [Actinomycetota bacterium]